jgi:hypothetical protein
LENAIVTQGRHNQTNSDDDDDEIILKKNVKEKEGETLLK